MQLAGEDDRAQDGADQAGQEVPERPPVRGYRVGMTDDEILRANPELVARIERARKDPSSCTRRPRPTKK